LSREKAIGRSFAEIISLVRIDKMITPKKRVIFVTPILQHPPKGGPQLRIENSIKALSRISDLHIYSRSSLAGIGGQSAVDFFRELVDGFYFAPFCRGRNAIVRFLYRYGNMATRTIFKRTIFGQETKADYQDLIHTAEAIKADVIWLGYGNISYQLLEYIKAHSPLPVVLDTDSVWSRFVLRGLPYAVDESDRKIIVAEGRRKEAEEQWGTKLANVTTAVSEVDADYYRDVSDKPEKIHLFSNVIDPESYKKAFPPENFKRPCLYLAGSFWKGSPMEESARWVLDKIFPLVRERIPGIHFYIIGSGSDLILSDINDKNVTITGELNSVLPYLANAAVSIVPLHFESGTRFKILEAGVCGIPVVSTTLGAEGICVTDGKDILIADSIEEFAECIVRLIENPVLANTMGNNLKKLVNNKYSLDVLAQEGMKILEFID